MQSQDVDYGSQSAACILANRVRPVEEGAKMNRIQSIYQSINAW